MQEQIKELLIEQLELLNKQSCVEKNSEALSSRSNSMANIANVLNYQRQIQSYSACGRAGQGQKSKEN